MKITKITRSYNRSVNTVSLMKPDPTKTKPLDSWAKFEAIYEADIESTDNLSEVSNQLHALAMSDVGASLKQLKEKINGTQK